MSAARAPGHSVTPDAETLRRVQALYDRGLYLQAFAASQPAGPLCDWVGPEAQVLAGRLAGNIGGMRLATLLHLRAGRAYPEHGRVRYYYGLILQGRRGPFAAWKYVTERDLGEGASTSERADWCTLKAMIAAQLRDFAEADRWLARSAELGGDRAWTLVVRSQVLESQDRYAESLAAARECVERTPWYRPGVQRLAVALLHSGLAEEALALLREADRRIESTGVAEQLADLEIELGLDDAALATLDRVQVLSPLIDRDAKRWLAARRSDVAWALGRRADAIALAREADSFFHRKLVARLEGSSEAGRVHLAVPFVRQHHRTCAPATLASLTAYLGRPVDHLSLADQISYDGTPGRKEREWATANGWTTREFRVTWEAAMALLERGVPFSLVTVAATSAHEQAVVGYDAPRGTFLVRDPSSPLLVEYLAEPLLEGQRSHGPRGFVVLPEEQRVRLDGLELPDAELYDMKHALEQALERHDRAAARSLRDRMDEAYPGHALVLRANQVLAAYDADDERGLAWTEALLEMFPGSAPLVLSRLAYLARLGRRSQRLQALEALCDGGAGHPEYWDLYADLLSADARRLEETSRLLDRARRARPVDAGPLSVTAKVLWQERRFEEALTAHRFAACLEDMNEGLTTSYFVAARQLGRTEEALQYLRDRFARFGSASGRPAMSLFWALEELGRADLAFETLEDALRRRADDSSLELYAAEACARYGDLERSNELLAAARPRARRPAWLRTAAALAGYRGDLEAALACWQEVLEAEPLAVDAHRAYALLLASTQSDDGARGHLRAACERHPHHLGLHQAWWERVREDGAEAVEPVLRHLLKLHAGDAWAHRELALTLAEQRQFDEAFAELDVARELEPPSASWHTVRGVVLAGMGRLSEARSAIEEAIRLDVNHTGALHELANVVHQPDERREAWTFVKEELCRQVLLGDSLTVFRAHARDGASASDLLETLRDLHARRPDLWQAWRELVHQLAEMSMLPEALTLATEAVARFPLVGELRLTLARVHRLRLDTAAETDALQAARRIDGSDGAAAYRLAEIAEAAGDLDGARGLLEAAVARAPLDAAPHSLLADLEWRSGRRDEALRRIERCLVIAPGWTHAWTRLGEWCRAVETPLRAEELARELTRRRPGEARSWFMLSETLAARPDSADERLDALDRAIALNPRFTDAHDTKAGLLAQLGRFDEAQAACRPSGWEQSQPLELRGREAWLLSERGRTAEAIARMRQVVTEAPSYLWGWTRLTEWSLASKDWPAYGEAAARLVELRPTDALSYGYRGDARRRLDDRAGAKADFERAMEIDARYAYARTQLVGLHLEDSDTSRASEVLQRNRPSVRDDDEIALEVRVHVAREERGETLQRVRELAATTGDEDGPLRIALWAIKKAEWLEDAEAILAKAAAAGEDAVAARLLASRLLERGDVRRCRRAIRAAPLGSASRRELLRALIEHRARPATRHLLWWDVWRRRRELVSHADLWGATGYALVSSGSMGHAIRWLRREPEQGQVRPWMLYNLVLALRIRGDDRDARDVGRKARLLPPDHSSSEHAVWLAADAAAEGTVEDARRFLEAGEPASGEADLALLWQVASALVSLRRGERDFAWFRGECARATSKYAAFYGRAHISRAYMRCVGAAARLAGTRGRWWAFRQWLATEMRRGLGY